MAFEADAGAIENCRDVIRLEYVPTAAERKEAESLVLAQTLGRGSARRAQVKLLFFLVGIIGLFVLFVVTVVPKVLGPYLIAAWLGLCAVLIVVRRRARRRLASQLETSPPVTVELSAQGFRIDDKAAKSQMMMPWDSFRRRFESESCFVFLHRTSGISFLIPKRALPSQESIEWIREVNIDVPRGDTDSPLPLTRASASRRFEAGGSEVTIEYEMGYWNCVDLSFASWGGARGVAAFMITLAAGAIIWLALTAGPAPNRKVEHLGLIVSIVILMILAFAVLFGFIVATQFWLAHRGHFKRRTVRLNDASLALAESDGMSEVPWSAFAHYKETPWSFLAWKGRQNWLLLPKSAFPSIPAQERCRELFARHLKRSTWFFGG
jgi:hypothetical protein